MTVGVLIVDDNPVVRMGLWSLLAIDDAIEVVGEASSGPEAVRAARELSPDVVLLDVRMPEGGGLDVLPELVGDSKVLMLTYSDEPAVVSEALRAGATGYLVHGAFESRELVRAIKDTADGRSRLSPSAAAVLMQGMLGGQSGPSAVEGAFPLQDGHGDAAVAAPGGGAGPVLGPEVVRRHRLSRREVEICTLLVEGASNSDIAASLFIEEKTVKNHINRIFAKLGASSRSEAIATCLGTRRAT
jgi:DNA-binding NarL/FixJ family response regulator